MSFATFGRRENNSPDERWARELAGQARVDGAQLAAKALVAVKGIRDLLYLDEGTGTYDLDKVIEGADFTQAVADLVGEVIPPPDAKVVERGPGYLSR